MKLKNKKHTKTLALLLTTSMMLCSTGCSLFEKEPEKMILKIQGSASLVDNGGVGNPWSNISFTTQAVFRNLFLAEATSSHVKPDLAESYTISEDSLTYEITLKNGIIWTDDEVLDIEDVVFSIHSVLLADKANSIFTTAFSTIEGATEYLAGETETISGIVADGNKLTITLQKPLTTFLQSLAQFAILPEHILKDVDMKALSTYDPYWLNPVVCGMYTIGEHIVGTSLEYCYNEKYVGTPPKITSLLVSDDFADEELDYVETNDISQILNYRSIPNKTEHKVNNLFYRYFVFNIDKGGEPDPVLSDIRVRKAITYAIDRNSLVRDIYYNTGAINNTGVVQEYNNPIDVDYPFDPEKAKELLSEAGYDFERPLTLLYYYSDETSISFIEAVAEYLEDVGFKTELVGKGNLYSEEFDHYDIGLKGLAALSVAEWYGEYYSLHMMHEDVFGGEPMFDELIDIYNASSESTDKVAALKELQELEYDLLYKYPVFTMGHMAYTNSDRVVLPDGVAFGSPRFKYDLNFTEWTINETK